MPFNASGVFQRLFNWRTDRDAGVKILADRMDREMDGFAAAINDVVQGDIPFRGPLASVYGTADAPAFSFTDDPDTGIYRAGPDKLAATAGGSHLLTLSPAGIKADVGLNVGAPDTASNNTKGVSITEGTTAGSVLIQATDASADSTPMLRLFAGTSQVLRVEKGGAAYLGGARIWTDQTAGMLAANERGSSVLVRNIGATSYGHRAIAPGPDLQPSDAAGQVTGSPLTGSWRVNGRLDPGGVTLVVKE